MLCQYTSFAEVAKAALGDGSGDSKEEVNDLAKASSFDAALANINSALRLG